MSHQNALRGYAQMRRETPMITVLVLNFASRAAGRCHAARPAALVRQLGRRSRLQRTDDRGADRARRAEHDLPIRAWRRCGVAGGSGRGGGTDDRGHWLRRQRVAAFLWSHHGRTAVTSMVVAIRSRFVGRFCCPPFHLDYAMATYQIDRCWIEAETWCSQYRCG